MRKIALLLALFGSINYVFAQNSAITKATTLLEKKDLAGAKEQIDLAIVHEKTSTKAKTWYTKGDVYSAIYSSETPDLAPNALDEAIAAYQKAKELEGKETGIYYIYSDQKIEAIWGNFLNAGATAFQEQNYTEAVKQFTLADKIKPQDTTAAMYAGIAAQQNDDHKTALTFYYKLLSLNYKSVDIYSSIIYLERAKNEDNTKAMEILKQARADFPDNKDLQKEEINILIVTGKSDDARIKLEEAIAGEPDNANLYYNLAFLYEEMKDLAKARENYKKALVIKPDYFDAAYNLAVTYYNEAADILQTANNMDLKTYQKSGKQMEERSKVIFKEAVPVWEAARAIEPENVTVLETLQVIYSRLNMMDKAEEIANKLDAINKGN